MGTGETGAGTPGQNIRSDLWLQKSKKGRVRDGRVITFIKKWDEVKCQRAQ